MSAPTEQEMLREARRVFRKLADARAQLLQLDARRWAVTQRGDPSSGRVKTSVAMVEAFAKRGWLEGQDKAWGLSPAGRNWAVAEVAGIDVLQAQHRRLALRLVRGEEGEESVVAVNESESPLAWLRSRGSIDAQQFDAGERLRRDYTLARLEPRMCIDLAVPVVLASRNPNGAEIADTVIAAKQRFAKAMSAAGAGLSDLLFDVCCALKGLELVEKEKDWPRRSGKVVLALALDRLADHCGIRSAPLRSHVRAWAAEGPEAMPA